ncbi:sugar O-acetyltransferase [Motilimonas pumila]|uniref:Acetyltransferase n=1 Tax=Motilimonas pumila TaxID=2303987 RepID=A0A418YKF9_9GAMM|nr:sugar O-acetyltransferase [Motilimonas pumila]RJG51465.1 sugar O-acetyltransferase [Motilimonas pumila]
MVDSITDFSVQIAADKALVAKKQACQQLVYQFNQTRPDQGKERKQLLKQLFAQYSNTHIEPPLRCDLGTNVYFGKGGFVNYGLIILDIATVTIGDYVLIGPNVQLCAASHPELREQRMAPTACGEPISIGNQAWIGAGSIVLAGVNIGENCIIGAGSVVTKDVPANHVAVGNPCRVLRPIHQTELDELNSHQN